MYYGFTDEELQAARGANLAEYFQTHGYDCELRRGELHVKGFGGFYIKTDTNEWYCFSKGGKNGGRNAINCLMEMLGMDLKTAVSELSGCSYSRSPTYEHYSSPPKKRELVLPERADNIRNVFAYLCQTRKIDSKIVSDLVRDGLLYQDKRGNAVFLHKDESGQIVGAELQGTNTYTRFKGVAAGTSDSLFAVKSEDTRATPNRAYVFESAIDLLSFKQLANPQKIQNSVLVSMAGLKPNSLKSLSEKGLRLFSCVDNDEAGLKFNSTNGLIPCNKILIDNRVKDYNELLQLITHNRETVAKSAEQHNQTAVQNGVKASARSARSRR